MRFNWNLLGASVLTAAVSYWMWTGTLVVSGQATGVSLAESRGTGTETAVRVRALHALASDHRPVLTIRGRLEAEARVEVRAETAGVVLARPVKKGDVVTRGTLLCRIDRGTRETRLLQARAQLAQADFDLDAANELRRRGNAPEARVQALRAAYEAAKAAVADAELDLKRTEVLAPIDGIVADKITDVGGMLQMGDVCATIVDLEPILATGQINEREVAAVAVGAPARVMLVSGEEVTGRVRYVAPSADTQTRTFRVDVEIENPQRRLREGVTTEIRLDLPALKAHLVPPSFLSLGEDGAIGVKTVGTGNRARFVAVRILAQTREGVWVAGLPDRFDMITLGHEFVRDGTLIDPVFEQGGPSR